jgi:hypothetical protein
MSAFNPCINKTFPCSSADMHSLLFDLDDQPLQPQPLGLNLPFLMSLGLFLCPLASGSSCEASYFFQVLRHLISSL